jgi:putative hydroxymethylpyrimidine transport system permease protein
MTSARTGAEQRPADGGAAATRRTPPGRDPWAGRLAGYAGAAAIVLVLFGAWELYAELGSVDDLILPAPHEVAQALWEDRALLWDDFTVTAGEVLLGILVAGVAGFACAVALHLSLALRRSVYPLLVASQTIPIPIVAALLVVWLGFDIAPKLVIIGLVSFFPIAVTTLDALARVDPEQLKLMRTLDASRLRILRHVELPAALPGLFSGAKIGVAVAVIGAVFAEQAGSSSGLGHLVQQAIPQLETARAYAAVTILSAFAITLFGLLTLAERLIVPWAHDPPGGINR